MMTKQQEFVKFYNGLSLTRQMQISNACIAHKGLAFCANNWGAFLSGSWSVPEYYFPLMWAIVDETYNKDK